MRPVTTVHRVPIPPGAARPFGDVNYADAFVGRTAVPDPRTAAEWLRAGLEDSPAAMRWLIIAVHRYVLRFRLGSRSSRGHVLGWQVTKLDPEDARLEASGPLITGHLVASRCDPHTVRLDTFLTFNKRRAAPAVWALVGPLHRRVAPYLLKRAAAGRSSAS